MQITRAALLLTDVVDSTRLMESLGDRRGAELWAKHDSVARELLEPHRGREIDKTDGFLLLFSEASDAVRYAQAYHRALSHLSGELGVALSARAGLHVGEVVLRENPSDQVARGAKPLEVEGIAKPTAARVMSVALAGQTLVSRDAADELPEDGIDGVRLESHGFWRMKGVAQPLELLECGGDEAPFVPPADSEKVYRVVRDGAGWVPVRELPGNLGPEPNTFIGRSTGLQQIAAAARPGARVTLTGPPGVGKSRLAARYARCWAGDYPGGSWRVRIPRGATPNELEEAVAKIVGDAGLSGALVLLDGLDGGEVPVTLGPATVLVTRRSVPPKAVGRVLPLGPLSLEEGAALFAARDGAGGPDHGRRLVQMLGGLPGAIEQAARSSRLPSEEGPYRGLESFRAEDADLFFGRDAEARSLAGRIVTSPVLTVTGASGAGKTSLLQAGVRRFLPGRPIVTLRPGAEPATALDRALEGGPPDGPVVLVVDQAEELVTITRLEAREAFAERLVSLADGGRFTVVLAVRGDFFARLAELAPLRGRYSRSVEVVVPPPAAALREILVQPLARFGCVFEDDALVAEMVDAVSDEPAALALLQFCASRLWADREGLVLTRAAYERSGGVEGALALHADEILSTLTPVQRREARRLLLRLITEERTRDPRRRTDLIESAENGAVTQTVLDRLVRSRLLSTFESEDGEAQVEIVHEALIRHWNQLDAWLQEDAKGHRMHRAVESASASWERRGRTVDLLWRGEVLAEVHRWRIRTEPRLTRVEDAFLLQSDRGERRRVRRRRIAVTVSFVFLLTAVIGALVLWRRAEDAAVAARASAKEAKLQHQLAVSDRERIRGNGLAALRLSRDVLRRDPDNAAARTVLAAMVARDRATLRLQSTTSDSYPPWNAQMDRFLLYEPEPWIVDGSGTRIARIRADPSKWRIARWSPDGNFVASRDAGRLWLWTRDGLPVFDVETGHGHIGWRDDSSGLMIPAVDKGSGLLYVGVDGEVRAVPPDARRVIVGPVAGRFLTRVGDGPVRLEDATGNVLATGPSGPTPCPSTDMAISPDGSRVVTFAGKGCRGGLVEVWSLDGVQARLSTENSPNIKPPEWSPDSRRLAVVYGAGRLLLTNADGEVLPTAADICDRIDAVSWRGDGQRLSVACEHDDRVALLDADGVVVAGWGTNPTGDPDGPRGIHLAGWSADGRRFATLDHTGTVGVWPGDGPGSAFAAADTVGCVFSPDGATVVSLTETDEQILWSRQGERLGVVQGADPTATAGAWSPDGARWAAVADGSLHLLDAETGQGSVTPITVGVGRRIMWSPQGDRMAVIGTTGAVLIDAAGGVVAPLEGIVDGVQSRDRPHGRWSPDGDRLIVAQDEGRAWLFDKDGTLLKSLERGRNVHLHWHPSGDRFQLSASPWESFGTIYDRDGEELNETVGVVIGPWSPDARHWLVSREKRAYLVTAEDEEVITAMDSRAWFWEGWWTTSGSRMIVQQIGRRYSVWTADGTLEFDLEGGDATRICVDPREEWVLTAGPTGLTRWPLGEGTLMSTADTLAPQALLERDSLLLK